MSIELRIERLLVDGVQELRSELLLEELRVALEGRAANARGATSAEIPRLDTAAVALPENSTLGVETGVAHALTEAVLP